MGLNTIIDGQSVIGLAKNDYYLQIVPQEIRELIDEIELKIINGEITVDSTYDLTLAEFNAIEDDVKVK